MNVLVYPHSLEMGGSQINAIDLAAAVRDAGHRVVVFAKPGPLAQLVELRKLRLIPAGLPLRPRPSPRVIRALADVVRTERIDLVHAFEPIPCLESFIGGGVARGVPVVGTLMGLWLPRFLPRSIPLTVGTREMQQRAQRSRPGIVTLLEPPIDTEENHPAVEGAELLKREGLARDRMNVVIVSRLSHHLKLEGIQRAIRAMSRLCAEMPVRLIVAGGGDAQDRVRSWAEAVNRGLGSRAIVLTGEMLDPRPAYAIADIVIGMGSSSLRGMAFGKPVIVVGEQGFSEIAAPESIDRFLQEGFYGIGDGDTSTSLLYRQLKELLGDEARRAELGRFGRELVCARFSVTEAARALLETYGRAINEMGSPASIRLESMFALTGVLRHKLERRIARARLATDGALRRTGPLPVPPAL